MRTLRDVEVGRRRVEVAVRRQPQLVALVLLCALRLEEDMPVEGELVEELRKRRVLRLQDDPATRLLIADADEGRTLNARRRQTALLARLRHLVDEDLHVAGVGTVFAAGLSPLGRRDHRRRRHHHHRHHQLLHVSLLSNS